MCQRHHNCIGFLFFLNLILANNEILPFLQPHILLFTQFQNEIIVDSFTTLYFFPMLDIQGQDGQETSICFGPASVI